MTDSNAEKPTRRDLPDLLYGAHATWRDVHVRRSRRQAGESWLFTPEYSVALALKPLSTSETRIEGTRLERKPVPIGSFSLFPPERSTWTHWPEISDHLVVCLSPKLIADAAGDHVDPKRLAFDRWIGERDPMVAQMGGLLKIELERKGLAHEIYVESIAALLAVHLVRRAAGARFSTPRPGLSAQAARLVMDYVEEHLARDMTLSELAALAGLSLSHFGRSFKAVTGLSPYRYVMSRRIERAKDLLRASDLSIEQIAAATGFNDQSHLTLRFRQATGLTPGAYRKTMA